MAPSHGLSAAGLKLMTASRASVHAYLSKGEWEAVDRCHVGSKPLLPYSATELFSGLVSGWASCANGSKKIPSNIVISGISRPSSHTTGPLDSLPWSCQVQFGVNTKSPNDIVIFSPSTTV